MRRALAAVAAAGIGFALLFGAAGTASAAPTRDDILTVQDCEDAGGVPTVDDEDGYLYCDGGDLDGEPISES
ncbi:hypothetical protein F0L68_38585 [Solihabitans fulvus]|uniref:Secreted protein n=1 Tax=Solihabitans fulvus TaxID=1892852 RepID=A0A5B2WKI8_9PSEU|nr:hypothetical protein [Solihabitans fulvus]KAA2250929.1 hypothetical protein F0L68_38585 [Solihabitans fulvus]